MSARKEFTKKQLSKILSAYKKGATLRALASEAECSVTTMRTLLIDNGVTMRPRGKVAAPAAKKAKAPVAKKAAAKSPKAKAKKAAKPKK